MNSSFYLIWRILFEFEDIVTGHLIQLHQLSDERQHFLHEIQRGVFSIDDLIQRTQNKIETLEKSYPTFLRWEECDLKNAVELINTWLLKVRSEEFT